MKYFYNTLSIAFRNIRSNPLHTFLSTLGIIIGVAALVGILALGDGLEQSGRQELSETTSISYLNIRTKQTKTVDDIRLAIQNPPKLTLAQASFIKEKYKDIAITEMISSGSIEVSYMDSSSAIYLQGNMENGIRFVSDSIQVGRYLSEEDVTHKNPVAVLTYKLAEHWDDIPENLIGKDFQIGDATIEIVGILSAKKNDFNKAYIPISVYQEVKDDYPIISMKVEELEQIPVIQAELKDWLNTEFKDGHEAFQVQANESRIAQFKKGILLFKLVMGAITGISVLVGGIGVMNVLLISVTERTSEIGIRKAIGAKKKDIIYQFLAESIVISFVGCLVGWVIGIAGIFIFVPMVNAATGISFEAAIGLNTVFVIMSIGLLIGLVFGTYPAWRAAQLTPVDAIRHE